MTTLQDIPMRSIRLQGEGWDRYVFNAAPRVDELAESIGRVGLINPLNVVESEGSYLLVGGYARALAVQRINWWTVPCFVEDGDTFGEEGLLRISVEDNRFAREYHYLDVARILLAFRKRCAYSDDRLTREIAPLLGVPSGERIILQYLSLNDMPGSLRAALVRERLSFNHAILLAGLGPEDALAMTSLFARTGASAGEAKEMAPILEDLARIRRQPLRRLVASDELKGLAKDTLCKKLRDMRYPAIAAAEEKFRKLVAQLRLDTNTSISHSPNFESDSLRININVRSGEELSSVLKKLSAGLEKGTIGEIFQIPHRPPATK